MFWFIHVLEMPKGMPKGKQGQARKKAPLPDNNDEEQEERQDDEMQLQCVAKKDKTSTSSHKTNTTNTPSIPLTARITKECDSSISMVNFKQNGSF